MFVFEKPTWNDLQLYICFANREKSQFLVILFGNFIMSFHQGNLFKKLICCLSYMCCYNVSTVHLDTHNICIAVDYKQGFGLFFVLSDYRTLPQRRKKTVILSQLLMAIKNKIFDSIVSILGTM